MGFLDSVVAAAKKIGRGFSNLFIYNFKTASWLPLLATVIAGAIAGTLGAIFSYFTKDYPAINGIYNIVIGFDTPTAGFMFFFIWGFFRFGFFGIGGAKAAAYSAWKKFKEWVKGVETIGFFLIGLALVQVIQRFLHLQTNPFYGLDALLVWFKKIAPIWVITWIVEFARFLNTIIAALAGLYSDNKFLPYMLTFRKDAENVRLFAQVILGALALRYGDAIENAFRRFRIGIGKKRARTKNRVLGFLLGLVEKKEIELDPEEELAATAFEKFVKNMEPKKGGKDVATWLRQYKRFLELERQGKDLDRYGIDPHYIKKQIIDDITFHEQLRAESGLLKIMKPLSEQLGIAIDSVESAVNVCMDKLKKRWESEEKLKQ